MPQSKDTVKEFDFNARDFERVRGLIYKRAGISLADSKQEMVYSRLARRLRATGIDSFAKYLDELEAGRAEETGAGVFGRRRVGRVLSSCHTREGGYPYSAWIPACAGMTEA